MEFLEEVYKLKLFIMEFSAKYGQPELVVASRVFKFPLEELFLVRRETNVVTLPNAVWEYGKVYVENVMYRQLFEIK